MSELPSSRPKVPTERNTEQAQLEAIVERLLHDVSDQFLAPPVTRAPKGEIDIGAYERWRVRQSADSHRAWEAARASGQFAEPSGRPQISFLLSICGRRARDPERTVDSVTNQWCPHWQLCLNACCVDDELLETHLKGWDETEVRVRITRSANHSTLENAWRRAFALSDGDLVALVFEGDVLSPAATWEFLREVRADPDSDVLYSDEDTLSSDGHHLAPVLKPDWSPDLMEASGYVGGLLVVDRTRLDEVGGFRGLSADAPSSDLALRATSGARSIRHVPSVLYHRRAPLEESDCARIGCVRGSLERAGETVTVQHGIAPGTFRVRRPISGTPRVSIIVPFRDEPGLLAAFLESVEASGDWPHWEAILVDNGSWQPETSVQIERLSRHPRCRVLTDPRPFNWSSINNLGVAHSSGEVLLFCNNDVEGNRQGWLLALLEQAVRPEVGAVGARLLYPNGTVQHGGVVVGYGEVGRHAFVGLPGEEAGYLGLAKTVRNVGAVTGACFMVRREIFDHLGGFDEGLPVAFNDIDFCLRVTTAGLRIVYTPFAELIHHESVSRGSSVDVESIRTMEERWAAPFRPDPFYSQSFHPLHPPYATFDA